MNRMFTAIAKVLKRDRGFTLVEMVTVVAIMGVMAAVAVPMVNTQLGKSRSASYDQDQALIQTAVDSYVSASDNAGYLGQRQYPILGANSKKDQIGVHTSTQVDGDGIPIALSRLGEELRTWSDTGTGDNLTTPLNAVRGTQGGEPKWRDGGDDSRSGEDNLNNETLTLTPGDSSGWYLDQVINPINGDLQAIDSRDYFIDFRLMVAAGQLQKIPESASLDNGGSLGSGSYSWYVKANGAVESLFFHFPENGTNFDGTTDGREDLRGYFDGVYP